MARHARFLAVLVALACLPLALPALADNTWPREVAAEHGTFTVYQPQPEKFAGNLLSGRAAISYLAKGKSKPVFGVFWFDARVDTDREAGTSIIRDVVVKERIAANADVPPAAAPCCRRIVEGRRHA